jgi:hypothetical protein
MKTLYATRLLTSVIILDSDRKTVKAIFPNTGYRPTKATKILTLNCWKWNLVWLDNNGFPIKS